MQDQKNIHKELQLNIEYLEQRFSNCGDIVKKKFSMEQCHGQQFYLIYADGLVDYVMIQDSIIRPLFRQPLFRYPGDLKEWIIESADRKQVMDMEEAVTNILAGNTLLFFNGCDFAIQVSSKRFPNRGIQPPEQEVSIRGPKDSFSESLRFNTALIRRRIRDSRLKVEQMQTGVRSKTDIALMYM